MPFGPLPNGNIKSGMRPGGFPISCSPIPPYMGAPHTQPYAIPSRGGVHGPIGAASQGPQAGNRGFSSGRGSAGGPIGGHLSHQGSQHALGSLGSGYNFAVLENRASQPSVGGGLTQTGHMAQLPTQGSSQNLHENYSVVGTSQDFFGDDFKSQGSHVAYNVADFSSQAFQNVYGGDYVTQGSQGTFTGDVLNQNSQSGYSQSGAGSGFMSQVQDYIPHGSQGLFTQVGFSEHPPDEPSQTFYGVGGPLQAQDEIINFHNTFRFINQGQMNPMYIQQFTQYTQPLNPQSQQQQRPAQQQGFHGYHVSLFGQQYCYGYHGVLHFCTMERDPSSFRTIAISLWDLKVAEENDTSGIQVRKHAILVVCLIKFKVKHALRFYDALYYWLSNPDEAIKLWLTAI
eukprot:Gb_10557 [translate_table: standard]